MACEGVSDCGGIGRVAGDDDDASKEVGWKDGFQFGFGPEIDDDLVLVGEEGREEAGTDVAGCAEEEDFHGGIEVWIGCC